MKKLKQWARENDLHHTTVYRWAKNGTMPVKTWQTETGMWFVEDDTDQPSAPSKTVVYARVSGHDQKDALDAQVSRIVQKYEGSVDKVITEIGSGMNPGRAKIKAILADPEIGTIVVENRDRLARMSVELIEAALAANNRKVVYIDNTVTDDTTQDIIEFMTSVCARMYGKRGANDRAEKALRAASEG